MKAEEFALATNKTAMNANQGVLLDAEVYLRSKIAQANDITIISAYYTRSFVIDLIKSIAPQNAPKLTIVFAAWGVDRVMQIDDLNELRKDLISLELCSENGIDIRVSNDTRFLHAKLIRLMAKGKPPLYVVGSANATNAAFRQNDEIMLVIKGEHPGLSAYINHVISKSTPVNDMQTSVEAYSWRDFLRNAYLYFRPNTPINYSHDPFSEDQFTDIAQRLKGGMIQPLPYSDSNGLNINIADLLNLQQTKKATSGFQLPTYSIETDYGYWVPEAYVDIVQSRLDDLSGPRRRSLEARGKELQEAATAASFVGTQMQAYFDAVALRLYPISLSDDQKASILQKVVSRVKFLAKFLSNPKMLERLSMPLIGAPVPEFWEDEASADKFFEGFCYDIVVKLNSPKRPPQIIKHLAKHFDIQPADDVDECRNKIEAFFDEGNSWNANDWPLGPLDRFAR